MRRRDWRKGAAALVTVLVMATVLSACGSKDDTPALSGDPEVTATTSPTSTSTTEPTGIEVAAGLNDPDDAHIAVLQFMPAKVTVTVGTPVRWVWNGTEAHSVTFMPNGTVPPPDASDRSLFLASGGTGPVDGKTLVNSDLQPLGPTAAKPYDITFTTPGTYTYYCVIHPNMVGTVTVSPTGGASDSPSAVYLQRIAEQKQWLAEGQAAAKELADSKPKEVTSGDHTTWQVQMGVSTEHTDVLAFGPLPNIEAGDSVEFVNESATPHTASFFGTGAEKITDPLDPRTDAPAPGPSPQTLSPAGFFNTGLLPPAVPPDSPPPLAARSYTFVVPTAGTYGFVCILHETSDMTGAITAT